MLGFYIYDESNSKIKRKSNSKKEYNHDLKMVYILGGLDVRQKPIHLANFYGRNIRQYLVVRITTSCSKYIKKAIIKVWNLIRWIVKEGDYMPVGEKLLAHNIIQVWAITWLTLHIIS